MADPEHPSDEARSLDDKLAAFEAGRARKEGLLSANHAMGDGYRFLGELVGGILGGLGLGWMLDRLAHTAPWGVIGGMLIGTGLSTWLLVQGAMRAAKNASDKAGPLPSVADDNEDDD